MSTLYGQLLLTIASYSVESKNMEKRHWISILHAPTATESEWILRQDSARKRRYSRLMIDDDGKAADGEPICLLGTLARTKEAVAWS